MKSFPIRLWRDTFSELSWLLRHGIPLVSSLSILIHQQRLKPLHFFFYHCIESISQGQSLSTAFTLSPQSSRFQAFLICGERSGTLDQTLQHCARWLTQTLQFQTQLRALAFYPLLLSIVLVAGTGLLIGVIVPQFHALYLSLHAPIPYTMACLWDLHRVLTLHGFTLFSCFALSVLSIYLLYRFSPSFRQRITTVLFRIPTLKMICHAHECAHLGTLLEGGVPLAESLNIVTHHAQFSVHQAALGEVIEAVCNGNSIAVAYRLARWHDVYLCDMLSIAEYTGTLGVCYLKCHDYYHEQLDDRLKRFKQEWQPIILLVMGLIVCVWVLLLYYPLIQLGYVVG